MINGADEMKKVVGIYLHIPFCLQKCLYCDFNSYSGILGRQGEYTAALCREISGFEDGCQADSIYFGGGTPTLLHTENIADIMDAVRKKFVLCSDCEITMECNPGTADKKRMEDLRRLGINRLSIGMQSSADQELKKLGRIHCMDETIQCVRDARSAGFSNLSLDLMYGLPDQSIAAWEETLEAAAELAPEHLSCYALKVEEGTPFAKMQLNLPEDDIVREMYDLAFEKLEDAGYLRYEISNFAKPGKESRHNLKYWNCDDFIGFGAGAYSCIHGRRFANVSEISRYIQHCADEERFIYQEKLNRDAQMSEFMFLGLRTEKGADLEEFEKRFDVKAEMVFAGPLRKYRQSGLICQEEKRVFLRKDMFFVSNLILADFLL